jgi:hypothetical protein
MEYIAKGGKTSKNMHVAVCVSGFHFKLTTDSELG